MVLQSVSPSISSARTFLTLRSRRATPLGLLAFLLALAYLAYLAYLRSQRDRLRALPADRRAALDEFLTKYRIGGEDLPPHARFVLIREEKRRRHEMATKRLIVVASRF